MTTDDLKGSIWIIVNASGKASCPHCELIAWVSGNTYGGCKHVIGPGTEGGKTAVIFKGDK